MVGVMPPPGKSLQQLDAESRECKGYAEQHLAEIAPAIDKNAHQNSALAVAAGVVIGALIGGGRGAAEGAIVAATLDAKSEAARQAREQADYDMTYGDCMYSKGDTVAGIPQPPPEAKPPGQQAAAGKAVPQ